MIGIDIVKIDRISNLIKKRGEKFLRRVFLESEISLIGGNANRAAGFFAAKEAASKALGTGIGSECGFLDIEILKNEKGAPMIKFSPKVRAKFGEISANLSISHDGGFAIAAVIVK